MPTVAVRLRASLVILRRGSRAWRVVCGSYPAGAGASPAVGLGRSLRCVFHGHQAAEGVTSVAPRPPCRPSMANPSASSSRRVVIAAPAASEL